jgi:hypothetical protein
MADAPPGLRFVLGDGWFARAVETVDELRAEDLIDLDPAEYSRFESGVGCHYWSLCDGDGNSRATIVLTAPLSRPGAQVGDVWLDECSEEEEVVAHVRAWFEELDDKGYSLTLAAQGLPEQPIATARELLALHDMFVTSPPMFLGGIDERWQLEFQRNEMPQFRWKALAEATLVELRSAWWLLDDRPEELYGQAWFTFLVLDQRIRAHETVRMLRDRLELEFNEKLEEMVLDELHFLGSDVDRVDVTDHSRYLELRDELAEECRTTHLLDPAFAFVQYLEDLLELLDEQPEALRQPLPALTEARQRVADIERAATWKPSTTPSRRISGLASRDSL